MKAKAFAILVVAAILLSGCASKKGKGDDDSSATSTATQTGTTSESSTKSGTASSTSTGSPAGQGTITVNFTRATPNGAAPLALNFSLGATFKGADGKPKAPASLSWAVHILSANATNATNVTSTNGPTGTTLPANFTLNFTAAGNHTVFAKVDAPGYKTANATILVMVSPGGVASIAPLFFDGAEGDASQFTISSNIWVYDVFTGTEQESAAPYPMTTWKAVTTQAHSGTKSWFSAYPDNYRTRMETLTIKAPPAGATLTYWVKGGAEENGADGVHVLVNGVEVALHNNVPDWTAFTAPVPGGDAKVLFRFDSDAGCSSSEPPADPGGICGAGYNRGGIYIDDITVA